MVAFSSETLAVNPGFILVLGHLARGLRALFDESPRLARSLASHQRWLLSQAAFALYLEYDPSIPASGLTAVRLKEMITPHGSASRNTVLNFLDEMVSYRFVRYVDEPGRRSRRLVTTEITDQAMFRWFHANLAALDLLDAGDRAETLMANPDIFRGAHPAAARASIAAAGWREPPPRVGIFLWTEAGGLVMDEMIARADPSRQSDGRMDVGRIDAREMATHFMMSRTHLQRLLKKAASAGCIGWYDDKRAGNMWFSCDFLDEYCHWQAIKFAIVDKAFHDEVEKRGENTARPRRGFSQQKIAS